MLCPHCHIDYEDSYRDCEVKRKVVGQKDHYSSPFRITGFTCPNCGEVMQFIQMPTGNYYHKNMNIVDPAILYGASLLLKDLAQNNQDQYRELANRIRPYVRKR
ncbi:MAG: hypothetical protein KKB34_10345 [Bacteroidetes bacterium]|nr:hypothetical protein [Bacteroidota bacterium]